VSIALLTADSDKITATPERYGFQARDGTTLASKVTAAPSPTQEAFAHSAQKQSMVPLVQAALEESMQQALAQMAFTAEIS
jgi:hypothetical protein